MSISRQITRNPDLASAPVVGQQEQWMPASVEPHAHVRHQLIYASRGVVHMNTSVGEWILPPSRAMWITGGVEHGLMIKRPVSLYVLYIDPERLTLPGGERCSVIDVSPLVRELIAACAALPWDYLLDSDSSRLAQVLIDRIQLQEHAPLELMMPRDPRALRIVELLRLEPGSRRSLNELAREAGASGRTIERLFILETQLTFGAWRHKHRMLYALERLAYGQSVTTVALEAGYESPSSFIAAFRAMFGTTPSKYF
ncbi:AraC family transcriptional regulator [Pectobacterium polaris]|uniref:AraC family transcriptional regulator n=1 Tax=Pectobacterium polaris TaxID=2042057 RepID=UPI000F8C738B|nr:helix-turn-helix domain-containing protein [Pectobacterium polaris]